MTENGLTFTAGTGPGTKRESARSDVREDRMELGGLGGG
jgi:hypothetical protein